MAQTTRSDWNDLMTKINEVRASWNLPAVISQTPAVDASVVATQWNNTLVPALNSGALAGGKTLANFGSNLPAAASGEFLGVRSHTAVMASRNSKMCTSVCPSVCTSVAHSNHASHSSHSSHSDHNSHASHSSHTHHSQHSNHGSHGSHGSSTHNSHGSHGSHASHTNHSEHASHNSHANHTNTAVSNPHVSHLSHTNTLNPVCTSVGV